jgi:hypothetical protein
MVSHADLLAKLIDYEAHFDQVLDEEKAYNALRAVVELHKPYAIDEYPDIKSYCTHCEHLQSQIWPCPTIQVIEKELA